LYVIKKYVILSKERPKICWNKYLVKNSSISEIIYYKKTKSIMSNSIYGWKFVFFFNCFVVFPNYFLKYCQFFEALLLFQKVVTGNSRQTQQLILKKTYHCKIN